MKQSIWKRIFGTIAFLTAIGMLMGGCSGGAVPAGNLATATIVVPEGTATVERLSTVTAESSEEAGHLIMWIPPDYDPGGDSPAGALIKKQLNKFTSQHTGIQVDVRLKTSTGPGNVMDALSTTNAAATASLPDLVALQQTDFQSAAIKGFIYPVDGLTARMESSDWFTFAKQLAAVEGTTFGVPFSGDVLVLVSHKEKTKITLAKWDDLLLQKRPLFFAASDPLAAFTLANYLSAGGKISNADGKPILDEEILRNVLAQYLQARMENIIQEGNANYSNAGQVWSVVKKEDKGIGVTWISIPMAEKAAGIEYASLPMSGDKSVTLADGMVWAMANPDTQRQKNALLLLDTLTEPDFLAEWCQVAACVPPRPSALNAYTDPAVKGVLEQIENEAEAMPSSDLINSLGPVLRDAALQVIRGQNTPEEAAKQASGNFLKP
jgi:ABC-type glycerol-3-phosphate transport system substrate-binding protein